jgi:hypothetical protein
LAAVFMGSGIAKSTMTKERMIASGQTGVASFPLPLVRFGAAMEVLGAIGLILPWLTGVAKVLTPLAATGLAVIMIAAGWSHTRLREPRNTAANALLFSLCVFVAVNRFAAL